MQNNILCVALRGSWSPVSRLLPTYLCKLPVVVGSPVYWLL